MVASVNTSVASTVQGVLISNDSDKRRVGSKQTRDQDVQVTPSDKTKLDRQVEDSMRDPAVASVSISKDGDTTVVSQSGIRALEDIEETSLTGKNADRLVREGHREDRDFSTEDGYEPEIDSLIGYTQQQVEQLYRDGRISYYKYEENIETREDRAEELVEAFTSRFDTSDTKRADDSSQDREIHESTVEQQASRLERVVEEEGRLWDYQLQA